MYMTASGFAYPWWYTPHAAEPIDKWVYIPWWFTNRYRTF